MSNKMTEKQIKEFLELEEATRITEEIDINHIMDNVDPDELKLTEVTRNISIDEYGMHNIISDNDITEEEQNRIDKLFEDAEREGKTITEAAIESSLTGIPGMKSDDIKKVFHIVTRYKNGEQFSIYSELPKPLKDTIKYTVTDSNDKTIKQAMAKQLIASIVSDAESFNTLDIMRSKMNNELKTEFNKIKNETISGFISKQKHDVEEGFKLKEAKLIEQGDLESAELAGLISKNFTDSYTLETLISHLENSYGKYKIKKIRLEKFNREIDSFNFKYINSPMNNKDLRLTIPVLMRHLNTDPNDAYSELDIMKFILVFITHTNNMKPDVIYEHTFMFYFIGNILLFDSAISESDKEFINTFISNIKKVINIIREKEKNNEKTNN